MATFLFTCLSMMCTISIAWGCVSGAGPSWEIGQRGRPSGRRRPTAKLHSHRIGMIRPAMKIGSSTGKAYPTLPIRPRIPIEVMRYFGGTMSKELAFASIDLDGSGLVSFAEWTSKGGANTEFNHMLTRLDTNGDNLISLAELQPFSLPGNSNTDTLPRDLPRDLPWDLPRDLPRDRLRDLPRDLTRDLPRNLPRDSPRNLPLDLHPDLTRDPRRIGPRGPFRQL